MQKKRRKGIRKSKRKIVQVEDYVPLIGEQAVERILNKARALKDLHVVNINSTYYGGGVAELLSSLTLLLNSSGIDMGWRVMQGAPDFFSMTKKIHNALQGGDIRFTKRKMKVHQDIVYENAMRNHLENHDFVIVHDPQPLPMIDHYPKRKGPWIWRLHIDLTKPNKKMWNYIVPWIEKYDAMVVSLPEYKKKLRVPQLIFMPAIDPFAFKNRPMTDKEMKERLSHYDVPLDLPLVVQVSRFDKWKDPYGVIKAFKIARKKVKCRLVLLGNIATDDPEGAEMYEKIANERSDDIIIPPYQDNWMVNALQAKAGVVLQKSIREGFGLTVAEAMWKETPVIGGNCGGIRHQISNGKNGFLVNSIQECADRIVQVLKDKRLARRLGKAGKETVRSKFLLTRLMEQYLDLFNSFKCVQEFKGMPKHRYYY